MLKITKLAVAIALLLGSLLVQRAHAHSTFIATYLLQQQADKSWQLTISSGLSALHQALLKHHSEDKLVDSNGEYNTRLASDYLKQHSLIKGNGQTAIELALVDSHINNHQSDFVFKLVNVPEQLGSLDFEIDAMAELPGHVNIVRLKRAGNSQKAILQIANDYRGSISLAYSP